MEKVLRKRAWRDLKENKFRYFALAFLIIISMYLVIRLVGAADTIVDGTTKQAKKHKLEDGQFQVFVPLTTKQKENFTKKGLTVEETFYLDFRQKDGSKLRIFKNRKKVNKINLDEGRLAKNKSEVVVEKRYAQEHNLKTGSKITIDGNFSKIARGTSIFCILPMVITSSFFYYKGNYIDWKLAILCAIGGTIGGYIGANILKKIPEKTMKIVFSLRNISMHTD